MDNQILNSQFKVINRYVDFNNYFTGLGVRKFWKQKVFDHIKVESTNHILSTGRWSAFGHVSELAAFKNIISKFKLEPGQRVICHPLINGNCLSHLLERHLEIEASDIDRNTWNWNLEALKALVNAKTDLKLAIIPIVNGLSEEICDQIQLFNASNVPVLLSIQTKKLTPSTVRAISLIKNGAVIYNYGQWNVAPALNQNLKTDLSLVISCYLSFFLEVEPSGLLDYAEVDSSEIEITTEYTKILSYLFKKQLKMSNWRNGLKLSPKIFENGLQFNSLFENSYKNVAQSRTALIQVYNSLKNASTISDLLFELDLLEQNEKIDQNSNFKPMSNQLLIGQGVNSEATRYRSFFYSQVMQRPPGSLETPSFFVNRTYFEYFVYSIETNFWYSYLKSQNIPCLLGFRLHPLFMMRPGLENARFIAKYAIRVPLTK